MKNKIVVATFDRLARVTLNTILGWIHVDTNSCPLGTDFSGWCSAKCSADPVSSKPESSVRGLGFLTSQGLFMEFASLPQMPTSNHGPTNFTGVQVECEMARSRPPERSSRAVFVSCSESDREFAEQLRHELLRAGFSPLFEDFPQSSSQGAGFASRVAAAAAKCELAIVVVSEDYFTRSKWAMVELVGLVEARGCRILLPLFLGLSGAEFREPRRRERWFRVWESWGEAGGGVSVDVWKSALRELDGLRDGVEHVKAVGEVGYRQEVLAAVCRRLPWRSHHEDIDVEKAVLPLGIQGLQRPHEGATRSKGWGYYTCLVFLTPVVFIGIICVGSVLYSAFFCDQGYPSPYGIIFPMI